MLTQPQQVDNKTPIPLSNAAKRRLIDYNLTDLHPRIVGKWQDIILNMRRLADYKI